MGQIDDTRVKVRFRYKPGRAGAAGERFWAEAIDANDGGGTYRLLNNSYCGPVCVGDVVSAALDGDGQLQVIDVIETADVQLSAFATNPRMSEEAVRAMGDSWRAAGASWSEGTGDVLVTVWRSEVTRAHVVATLENEQRAGHGELVFVAGPEERTRDQLDHVDFTLDTVEHFPPVETTYWAPDDPYWREHALDDPEFLGYVQHLAGQFDEVRLALEAGDHARAMEIIEWINGSMPA
jgi:hypothetical protein